MPDMEFEPLCLSSFGGECEGIAARSFDAGCGEIGVLPGREGQRTVEFEGKPDDVLTQPGRSNDRPDVIFDCGLHGQGCVERNGQVRSRHGLTGQPVSSGEFFTFQYERGRAQFPDLAVHQFEPASAA